MNNQFKSEFKNLSKEEIKKIINGCAGRDILETSFIENIKVNNYDTLYNIVYVDNEKYGFWVVEWNLKKFENNFFGGYRHFENTIKISPFRIDFEIVKSTFNSFASAHSKKQLEEYMQVYINRKCPHYKQTIIEETENFIKMLDYGNDIKTNTDQDLSK